MVDDPPPCCAYRVRERDGAEERLEQTWCYVGDGYGEFGRHSMLQEVVRISGGKVPVELWHLQSDRLLPSQGRGLMV